MLRRFARLGVSTVTVWLAGVLAALVHAAALTPDSPEVQTAIRKAVKYLESDEAKAGSAGMRALVGLALLKSGADVDDARVQACLSTIQGRFAGKSPVISPWTSIPTAWRLFPF